MNTVAMAVWAAFGLAGIWLLLEMIDAGVPGVYALHYGEERGGVGSSGLAEHHAGETVAQTLALFYQGICRFQQREPSRWLSVAPVLLVAFGWAIVPQVYAAIMLGTLVLFWLFSHSDPSHLVPSHVKFTDQLKALKDPKVLKYCQYYSIVFGGYVALSLWMVQYYVGEYGLDIRIAALLAACFSLPGGVLRAIGGVLSDKYGAHKVTWWVMWVSWICLFLLSYPQTDFTVLTVNGPSTFHIGLNVYAFTGLMAVLGVAMAFGKASVFKYISDDYPGNIGAISGIVGLAGGLGGFVLPIMFGLLMDLTGIRSSAFMLMYGVVWVSLIWMYLTEVRQLPLLGESRSASGNSQH